MNNSSLNAISPIDGRYSSKTSELNKFFSEKALMKYRQGYHITLKDDFEDEGIDKARRRAYY